MSKENDKIFRTLEHIAITFDKLGYSPTIPIFKGHQDFEWSFKLELDTIKALCNKQDKKIIDLEAKLAESEIRSKESEIFYKREINRRDTKLRNIKQQLAEKELDAIRWKEHFNNAKMDCECLKEEIEKKDDEILKGDCAFVKEVYTSEQEINELKKQLAEKDETIKELKQRLKDTIKIYSDDFVEKDKELKELRFKARNIFPLVENLEEKVNQDKISFAVEQLRRVKKLCKEKFDWWENSEWEGDIYDKSDVSNAYFDIEANIDEQIGQLTHQHEDKGE